MTTQQLKNRINTHPSGHGHYKVTIEFRGKSYSRVTNNMGAIDRLGEERRTPNDFYVTEKQALISLWNEVKKANDLN